MSTNARTEKLNATDALRLIFSTTNALGTEHPRVNPAKVEELAKTLGSWRHPTIVTTPRGVVLEGLDYLGALAASGKEAEVIIDRTGRGKRRASPVKEPVNPVALLERAGIEHAAFKLAVWRGIQEGVANNPKPLSPAELKIALNHTRFKTAFDALYTVYIQTRVEVGGKESRVRSKIAFAAFTLAYHSDPKRIIGWYRDFLSGKVEAGTPLGKLLHAVRTDVINSGSGRRPFMLKAARLLQAQLAGDEIERAIADEVEGSKAIEILNSKLGNA